MPATTAALPRYRAALRHRDLRRLLLAYAAGATGTWASAVVLTAWVFERTGSLVWLAALAATRWVPGMLAAPFAGVLADRFDRRAVLVVSAGASCAVAAAVAVVVAADGPPAAVLALLVLAAVAASPYRPAAGALTPDVVGAAELPTANAMLAAVENLVVVVGPAIGAVLLLLEAPAAGVAAGAAGYALAALLAASLRARSRGAAGRGSALGQLVLGVRAVRATPTALVLIVFAAADTMLAWSYGVVYVPLALHLDLGPGGYGLLLVAAAVGGLAGAVVADRLSTAQRLSAVLVLAMLGQALPYALTAFTTDPFAGLALQAVSGAGMVVVEVLTLVTVQREVPIGRLSSVLGLLDLTTLLASAIGSFVASAVLTALPTPTALLVLGAGDAVLALALAPLLVRSERRAARRGAALAARVAVLQALPQLAGLSRRRLEALAAAAQVRALAAGSRLPEEVAADALVVLADGRLTAEIGGLRVHELAAPDAVPPVLRGTAEVTARTACTLLRIAADDYLDSMTVRRLPRVVVGAPTARLRRPATRRPASVHRGSTTYR